MTRKETNRSAVLFLVVHWSTKRNMRNVSVEPANSYDTCRPCLEAAPTLASVPHCDLFRSACSTSHEAEHRRLAHNCVQKFTLCALAARKHCLDLGHARRRQHQHKQLVATRVTKIEASAEISPGIAYTGLRWVQLLQRIRNVFTSWPTRDGDAHVRSRRRTFSPPFLSSQRRHVHVRRSPRQHP